MPSPPSKWDATVEKLFRMTVQRELEWTESPMVKRRVENIVGNAYETSAKDKSIAVYEYRYKHFINEEEWEWANEVSIEFVDGAGMMEWKFPQTGKEWDLIDAIRYQAARADQFLEEFLG